MALWLCIRPVTYLQISNPVVTWTSAFVHVRPTSTRVASTYQFWLTVICSSPYLCPLLPAARIVGHKSTYIGVVITGKRFYLLRETWQTGRAWVCCQLDTPTHEARLQDKGYLEINCQFWGHDERLPNFWLDSSAPKCQWNYGRGPPTAWNRKGSNTPTRLKRANGVADKDFAHFTKTDSVKLTMRCCYRFLNWKVERSRKGDLD